MRVATLCATPSCRNTTTTRLCPPCEAARNARRGTSGWERQKVANEFKQAHPDCAICGEPVAIVDHIRRLADGGADADSNKQSLCRPCDLRKQEWERMQ